MSKHASLPVGTLIVVLALLATRDAMSDQPVDAERRDVDLFVAKTNGYHTYRIPALIGTTKGTLLALLRRT